MQSLREANDAFQKKDYASALKMYEQVEEAAADPGLVAFNKAATLVRLGRLREAELCYLRCLQDGAVSAERRLRALYDLGTTLLQRGAEGKDAGALGRAVQCFELAIKEGGGNRALREDAEHNLDLARIFWLEARALAKAMDQPHRPPPEIHDPRDNLFNKRRFGDGGSLMKDGTAGEAERGQANDKDGSTTEKDIPGTGTVDVLADTDELQPLDARDARELLARELQRIQREQAQGPVLVPREDRNVKDW
jgi:tetratricopeptide (TPR) repeat protein